ncbi:agamous-like MADS-box protein AGL61 [Punica granatum]|uniref:MADS-box domain-containing protein n=2 Tax=Punica granatum TaxID=22663 RepID=A0A218VXP6_PUNGR|nr:agamous-like MADS-box protein AGL61 [Punica granatum]OWM64771.1 hypothetical protein CDL15_Pgr028488 [Punica granatum]PKI71612.1 hypothetical protein CRG98_007935 [Punica granatum]
MAKKPSLGRQKIAIAKIPKKNHLQVTFSKRRSGLFKKASELCTLCGVEITILVFSPASKAFSFGHPEVDSILDRFLACNNPALDSGVRQLFEVHRSANIRELNGILTQVMDQLEVEKRRGEELDNARKGKSQYWWESPIDEINNPNKLEQLRSSLEELKQNVMRQTNKLMMDPVSLMTPFLGPDCNGSNSSGDQFERKPNLDQVNHISANFLQYFSFPQENGLF